MNDAIMVALWKIAGVKRILQALQTTQLSDAVDDNVCFVLSEALGDAIDLLKSE